MYDRPPLRQVSRAARGDPPPDDCLTSTWLSNRRHAFIDVRAGPFSWGPKFAEEFAEEFAEGVTPTTVAAPPDGDLGEFSAGNGPSAEALAHERSVLHEATT